MNALQDFRKILSVERFPLSRADYGYPIRDLVENAELEEVDPQVIFPGNFQIFKREFADTLLLASFGEKTTYDRVIEAFDFAMFRPASLPELLMLSARHPEEQVKSPILALDSVWQKSVTERFVPGIHILNSKRNLFAAQIREQGWASDVRFAAVVLTPWPQKGEK